MCNNISFVIRCHNHEKTIGRCIESIISEAKRYWGLEYEIVILHDGTDNTVQEALKYNKAAPIRIRFAAMGPAINRKFNLHAYIDPTYIIPPDWIGSVTHTFLNPQVLAVTGPVLNPEWKLYEHLQYMIKWYWHKWFDERLDYGNYVIRCSTPQFNKAGTLIVMEEKARVFRNIS